MFRLTPKVNNHRGQEDGEDGEGDGHHPPAAVEPTWPLEQQRLLSETQTMQCGTPAITPRNKIW